MYALARPILFSLEPEKAHELSLSLLKWCPKGCFNQPESKPVSAMGLNFSHPIGLAAGLDKNGDYLDALAKIGFSFIEIGTVTPLAQRGNPKPRLFRLPEAGALINRMGFNNKGVDALVENLKKSRYRGILGINIGKNKDTSLARAAEDYTICLSKVYPYASYVTINISSPNTPDLRLLQQETFFRDLLTKLSEEQKRLTDQYQRMVSLAVKVSPDESDETLKKMAALIVEKGISAIIATNTTNSREEISSLALSSEAGGLSGLPLANRSNRCLKLIKEVVGNKVTLIGVGGIDSPRAAQEKLDEGANLLQVYTGLIYKGPRLIKKIVEGLK